uniref:Uncharacterized protein n=1 Tax=Arundo donax TaxID=35708 RepID=A0A0A9CGH5_ARUDO
MKDHGAGGAGLEVFIAACFQSWLPSPSRLHIHPPPTSSALGLLPALLTAAPS